ncbi:MAG: hypothetical protein JRH15_19630 [Deltaproteobacteria bacterium]|nr:hypothetical protein [Deltaproteobacteria bacterium]
MSGPSIVHHGKYHHATTNELETLIQQYDDPEKAMGIYPAWREKGFKHYVNWYYTKWAVSIGKKVNKSQLYKILERTDFLESTNAED